MGGVPLTVGAEEHFLDCDTFGAGYRSSIDRQNGGSSLSGKHDSHDLGTHGRYPHGVNTLRPHHGLVVQDECIEAVLIQHAYEMPCRRESQIVAEVLHLAAINDIPPGFRGVRLRAYVCVMLTIRAEHYLRRSPRDGSRFGRSRTPRFRLAVHHHAVSGPPILLVVEHVSAAWRKRQCSVGLPKQTRRNRTSRNRTKGSPGYFFSIQQGDVLVPDFSEISTVSAVFGEYDGSGFRRPNFHAAAEERVIRVAADIQQLIKWRAFDAINQNDVAAAL